MWLLFTQLSSFSDAIKNVLLKAAPKEASSVVINWSWLFFTILVLLPLGLWNGIPALSVSFWIVIGLRMIMDPVAIWLFTQSVRNAEMSFVLPLLTIGPVITMFTSFFLNDEHPTLLGIAGFILILIGMYVLNSDKNQHFFAPFARLMHSRESLCMLIAAGLWGVQVALFKYALLSVPAAFFTLAGTVGVFLVFTIVVFAKYRHEIPALFSVPTLKTISLIGILDGITVYFRMIALTTGLAAYVSALNRSTIIFSTFFGMVFWKEKVASRIIPIVLMILGVVLISLG